MNPKPPLSKSGALVELRDKLKTSDAFLWHRRRLPILLALLEGEIRGEAPLTDLELGKRFYADRPLIKTRVKNVQRAIGDIGSRLDVFFSSREGYREPYRITIIGEEP